VSKRNRDPRMKREMEDNAVVKCEICDKTKRVNVLFCLQNGWPTCCGVGGTDQTMALIPTEETILLLKEAAPTMFNTKPITGVMNWPLFYKSNIRVFAYALPEEGF